MYLATSTYGLTCSPESHLRQWASAAHAAPSAPGTERGRLRVSASSPSPLPNHMTSSLPRGKGRGCQGHAETGQSAPRLMVSGKRQVGAPRRLRSSSLQFQKAGSSRTPQILQKEVDCSVHYYPIIRQVSSGGLSPSHCPLRYQQTKLRTDSPWRQLPGTLPLFPARQLHGLCGENPGSAGSLEAERTARRLREDLSTPRTSPQ